MIKVEDEQEGAILEKFKAKTEDLKPDDVTCLRFLRARDHDLTKAEDMFRKSHQWRVDNDVSSYLKWTPPKVLAEHEVTFRLTGHDNDGRAVRAATKFTWDYQCIRKYNVVFIPIGKFNGKDLIEAGHKEELINFIYHLLESLTEFIAQSSCSQCVAVLDITGLAMRQLLHMETMQTLYSAFQNLEQNYPEILRHLICINAPWIFSIGFNFIKPILSKHTMSKIQIFNSDTSKWIKALLEIMPNEAIPKEYFN